MNEELKGVHTDAVVDLAKILYDKMEHLDLGSGCGLIWNEADRRRRAIACNVAQASSHSSRGSLAFVLQLSGDRARVLTRSRGGRWISCWMRLQNLKTFRFKYIPKEHPLFDRIGDIGHPQFFDESLITALNVGQAAKGL